MTCAEFSAVTSIGVDVVVRRKGPLVQLRLASRRADAEWLVSGEEAELLRQGLNLILVRLTEGTTP